MNELIKIGATAIGGENIQTCNARDLHAFLGVGRDFSNWIKDRIEKYGFTEGVDFVKNSSNIRFANSGESDKYGKSEPVKIDYFLSLNMAKELAMVERTDKGREARRYFIQCEAIAKQASARPVIGVAQDRAQAIFYIAEKVASLFHVSKERAAASALATIQKDMGVPSEAMSDLIPSVPVEKAALLNPTEVGKRLVPAINAAKVNQLLSKLGFQERLDKGWKLTEAGSAHGENRPYERSHHSGLQIQWRDSIVPVLQASIGEE